MATMPADLVASEAAQVQVAVRSRFAVVVSQCCTIEQQDYVQLAAVREMRRPSPDRDLYQALRSTWPPVAGQPYHGFWHPLDEHPALVAQEPDRMFFVDFTVQMPVSKPRLVEAVRARRVARMTIESRRDLRYRLMYFYGRTEATDADYLDSIGLVDPFRR